MMFLSNIGAGFSLGQESADGWSEAFDRAITAYRTGDYGSAAREFELAVSKATTFDADDDRLFATRNNLAMSYVKRAQFLQSEVILQDLLCRCRAGKEQSNTRLGDCLHNLALLYERRDLRRKWLGALNESQELYERSIESSGSELADRIYLNGIAYWRLGRPNQAEAAFTQARSIYRKFGAHAGLAASLLALGTIRDGRREYDQSEEYYGEAVSEAAKAGRRDLQYISLVALGRQYRRQGRKEQAVGALSEAAAIYERFPRAAGLPLADERAIIYTAREGKVTMDETLRERLPPVLRNNMENLFDGLRDLGATLNASGQREQGRDVMARFSVLKQACGLYLKGMQREIDRHWDPPVRHTTAETVVEFSVSRKGAIRAVQVIRTSGLEADARQALNAIEAIGTGPALPAELKDEMTLAVSMMVWGNARVGVTSEGRTKASSCRHEARFVCPAPIDDRGMGGGSAN
jgi:tetratricopeptide (TPR) repeat protein